MFVAIDAGNWPPAQRVRVQRIDLTGGRVIVRRDRGRKPDPGRSHRNLISWRNQNRIKFFKIAEGIMPAGRGSMIRAANLETGPRPKFCAGELNFREF